MIRNIIKILLIILVMTSNFNSAIICVCAAEKKQNVNYEVKHIEEKLSSMLTGLGKIVKTFDGKSDQLLYFIEDLHCHKEAQGKISKIIGIFNNTHRYSFINKTSMFSNKERSKKFASLEDSFIKFENIKNKRNRGKQIGRKQIKEKLIKSLSFNLFLEKITKKTKQKAGVEGKGLKKIVTRPRFNTGAGVSPKHRDDVNLRLRRLMEESKKQLLKQPQPGHQYDKEKELQLLSSVKNGKQRPGLFIDLEQIVNGNKNGANKNGTKIVYENGNQPFVVNLNFGDINYYEARTSPVGSKKSNRGREPKTSDEKKTKLLAKVEIPWIPYVKDTEENYYHAPCALCGFRNNDLLGIVKINGRDFNIVKCKNEGLIHIDPIPDDNFYKQLYTKDYYGFASKGKKTATHGLQKVDNTEKMYKQLGIMDDTPKETERRQKIAKVQIDEIKDSSKGNKEIIMGDTMFLEIGGGTGYLSKEAQNQGMDVLNVEMSEYAAGKSSQRGVTTFNGTIEQAIEQGKVKEGSCDIIACYDLFEHITNPNEFLQIIKKLLKKDGMLCTRMPCTPKHGPKLHLVDHVYHYNASTIKQILEKNGFKVKTKFYSGTFHDKESCHDIDNMTIYAVPLEKDIEKPMSDRNEALFRDILLDRLDIKGARKHKKLEFISILFNQIADIYWGKGYIDIIDRIIKRIREITFDDIRKLDINTKDIRKIDLKLLKHNLMFA